MSNSIEKHVQLENCSIQMMDAGLYVWAMGTLIKDLVNRGIVADVLDESVLDGLSSGMIIVGEHLRDGADRAKKLLSNKVVGVTK
jgi:hypothetical protein